MERAAATTVFEGVELEGWAYAVGGVRVVMDSDFDEDELATICDRLRWRGRTRRCGAASERSSCRS